MKIIGQSSVADGNPYVHLGYVAAAPAQTVTVGIVVVLIGIRAFWMKAATRRGRSAKNVFSCCVLAAGCALLLIGLTMDDGIGPARIVKTRSSQRVVLTAIRMARGEGRSVEDGIKDCTPDSMIDAWGRAMRIEQKSAATTPAVTISSAGKDGRFGTADDVVTAE